MSPETLQVDITRATAALIKMAREHSWNNISGKCAYILNKSDEDIGENYLKRYAIKKINNDRKNARSLNDLMPELLKLYPTLHEIDLYVYRAFKSYTTIEIEYIIHDPMNTGSEFPDPAGPMLHCKVKIPVYNNFNKKEKFDINWPHYTSSHRWNMFWYRLKLRLKVNSINYY